MEEVLKTINTELGYLRKCNRDLEAALRETKADRDDLSRKTAHYNARLIELQEAVQKLHETTPLDFRALYSAHGSTMGNRHTNLLYELCGKPSY